MLCLVSSSAVSDRSPCVGVVALFFVYFLSVFDPTTIQRQRFAIWCATFRTEAHVSELSSSVEGMATFFPFRRPPSPRVSAHFPNQGPAVLVPCEGQREVAFVA